MTTYLYAIGIGTGGPVKIGISRDPKARLAQIQTSFPMRLVLIGTKASNVAAERAIHQLLGGARVSGEWFKRSPEVEQFLATLTPAVSEPPSLVDDPELLRAIIAAAAVRERACPVCAKKFDRNNGKQKYCSARCRFVAWSRTHRRKKAA